MEENIMTQDELHDIFAELFRLSDPSAFLQAIAIQNHFINLWDFCQSAQMFSQSIIESKKSYSQTMLIHLLDEHAKVFEKFSDEQQKKVKNFHQQLEQIHLQLVGPS